MTNILLVIGVFILLTCVYDSVWFLIDAIPPFYQPYSVK